MTGWGFCIVVSMFVPGVFVTGRRFSLCSIILLIIFSNLIINFTNIKSTSVLLFIFIFNYHVHLLLFLTFLFPWKSQINICAQSIYSQRKIEVNNILSLCFVGYTADHAQLDSDNVWWHLAVSLRFHSLLMTAMPWNQTNASLYPAFRMPQCFSSLIIFGLVLLELTWWVSSPLKADSEFSGAVGH